ncbi:MAG: hypothetical protein ACTTKL_10170 [Treponema sp.]
MISKKLLDDIQRFLEENYESGGKEFWAKEESPLLLSKELCIPCGAAVVPQFKERAIESTDVDAFIKQSEKIPNFQNTLQRHIADRRLENAAIYKKACIDKKFFSKIISHKDYVPKKQSVMALGLALELPLDDFERFLASAGYAFMPSSKADLIVKYCVMNQIYNLIEVDGILDSYGFACFSPK